MRYLKVHYWGWLLIIMPMVIVTSCVEHKTETITKKDSPVTAELISMIREHDAMALDNRTDPMVLTSSNLKHRQQVFQFLSQSLLTEPADLYRAALVLSTTDTSTSKENLMLAYYLAMESARKGFDSARHLSAVSLDKYLVVSGLNQKYGTQIAVDRFGRYYLSQYDTTTTDGDRAVWDVSPLDTLLKRVEAMNTPVEKLTQSKTKE